MIARMLGLIQRWEYRRRYPFRVVGFDALLRGQPDLVLDMRGWDSDDRAGDFHDSLTIASIARILRPKVYWEIGTGAGRTALLVARNTPDETLIFTLDPGYPNDPEKGIVFRDLPEAEKIKQFGEYSSQFDFSPWTCKADLVFVDGSHKFTDVLSDSEFAFRLVARGGWILWHDVAMDNWDVAAALKRCSRADRIELIAGTRYALYREPYVI